jgi:hypothetical protein
MVLNLNPFSDEELYEARIFMVEGKVPIPDEYMDDKIVAA